MNRFTSTTITSGGSGSWVCPAGVTEIYITPVSSGITVYTTKVAVVPNTTYVVTFNLSGAPVVNTTCSFGSIYFWWNVGEIYLTWVE